MPVNLQNTFDASALAALANKQLGSLNLPLHPIMWGEYNNNFVKAAQAQKELQLQAQQQQNQMDMAKLAAQTGLLTNQSRINADYGMQERSQLFQAQQNREKMASDALLSQDRNAMRQVELQQQAAFQAAQLGLKQQELESNMLSQQDLSSYRKSLVEQGKERNQLEKTRLDLESKLKMSKDQLKERTALAGVMLNMANDEKYKNSPDLLLQDQNKAAGVLLKAGKISPEEYQQFTNITDPSQRQVLLQYELTTASLGQDLAGSKVAAAILGQGNTKPLSESSVGKIQEQLVSINNFGQQLDKLNSMMDPEIFSYVGQAKEHAGQALSKSPEFVQKVADIVGSPFGFSVKDSEKSAAQQTAFNSQVNVATLESMKAMLNTTGMRPQTLRMLQSLLPDEKKDSELTAKAKVNQLIQMNNQTKQFLQNAIKTGVPLSSISNQLDHIVANGVDNYQTSLTNANPAIPQSITYNGKTYNADQIARIAKHNNMSVEDAVKYMQGNQ